MNKLIDEQNFKILDICKPIILVQEIKYMAENDFRMNSFIEFLTFYHSTTDDGNLESLEQGI